MARHGVLLAVCACRLQRRYAPTFNARSRKPMSVVTSMASMGWGAGRGPMSTVLEQRDDAPMQGSSRQWSKTTKELALVALAARRVDGGDRVLAKSVAEPLIHALRMQHKRGKIAIAGKERGAIMGIGGAGGFSGFSRARHPFFVRYVDLCLAGAVDVDLGVRNPT
jgi:hypothetical protein